MYKTPKKTQMGEHKNRTYPVSFTSAWYFVYAVNKCGIENIQMCV